RALPRATRARAGGDRRARAHQRCTAERHRRRPRAAGARRRRRISPGSRGTDRAHRRGLGRHRRVAQDRGADRPRPSIHSHQRNARRRPGGARALPDHRARRVSVRPIPRGIMLRRLVLSALLFPIVAGAQSQQEFAARRSAIVGPMSDGVLVALGAHEPPQDYVSFVQSPSFYYLTGFKEPDAALIVVKQGGQVVSSTMFVQPRLPSREVWTGTRTGVEGIATLTGMKGRDVADLPKVLDSLAGAGVPFSVVGDISTSETTPNGQANTLLVPRTPDDQVFERLQAAHPGLKVV